VVIGPDSPSCPRKSWGIRFVDSVPEDSCFRIATSRSALGGTRRYRRRRTGDIFLAKVGGPSALYKNLGNWKFRDITRESGLELKGRNTLGATFVDIEWRWDLDLFVTSLGAQWPLLNDGHAISPKSPMRQGSPPPWKHDSGRSRMWMAMAPRSLHRELQGQGCIGHFPPRSANSTVVRRVGDHFEVAPRFREHYRVQMRPDLGAVVRTQRRRPDWFYSTTPWNSPRPFHFGRFLDEEEAPRR